MTLKSSKSNPQSVTTEAVISSNKTFTAREVLELQDLIRLTTSRALYQGIQLERSRITKLAQDLATWDDALKNQIIYLADLEEALIGHKETATDTNRDCE